MEMINRNKDYHIIFFSAKQACLINSKLALSSYLVPLFAILIEWS